jgi:hypothetical protein
MDWAKVMGRNQAADGTPVGAAHSNPILDTRQYKSCLVGTECSSDARTDHPKGENSVLEADSQVHRGTPKECEVGACDQRRDGDSVVEGRDQKGNEECSAGFRVPR